MKSGNIEYKMPNAMAKQILKQRKGNDAKKNAQEYLVNYVNEQYGLLRKCSKVILY